MSDRAISPDKAISPLRRRMIEDMAIPKFAPKTQHDYVQRVKDFAAFIQVGVHSLVRWFLASSCGETDHRPVVPRAQSQASRP
jgi:hypothetical protein